MTGSVKTEEKKKNAGFRQFKLFIFFFLHYLYCVGSFVLTFCGRACVCVCVHACVSQLDDECADSGGVSVTDSVVNWPLSLEPNLEQHSPKSLNLLLGPNTHTHTCAHIFPAEYVPLVAGRAWFDRERLAPYHVY